jgi:hypothetical protein
MAAVRKIQIHQRSHLIWIKASDANTKLFHLRVNARCRKNYIPVLQHGSIICTTQQAKAAALHQHFSSQLGSAPRRHCMLNWIAIGSPLRNLQDLDNDLTEAEIQAAVMQMSTEKVSGPDDYIGGGGVTSPAGTSSMLIWWLHSSKFLDLGKKHGNCLTQQILHYYLRRKLLMRLVTIAQLV